MSSKKKLSLKEFMQDESLGGGSWADDDFDPSSISVPISNQRHHHDRLNYQSDSHSTFLRPGHYNDGPKLPPYIVKLSNIPNFFGINEIKDLFQSRFTKFIKMKLFWEIDFHVLNSSRDPLDALNKRKKVSFVELDTLRDFEKVLKWNDLYLERGLGKILVNSGNFDDFRVYNDLNQKVSELDDPTLPLQQRRHERGASRSSAEAFQHPGLQRHTLQDQLSHHPPNQTNQTNRPLHPLDRLAQRQTEANIPRQQQHQPIIHPPPHHIPSHEQHELPPLKTPATEPKPVTKPNPFGSAKPVDTFAKQQEIEKKLKGLEINKTTFRTLGSLEAEEKSKEVVKDKKLVAKEEGKEKKKQSAEVIKDDESKKTESRQSPSLASLHLKKTQQQQQQNSPKNKKVELVAAPLPEVGAWSSPDLRLLQSESQGDSPQSKSPTSEPTKLSASVFQGKNKHNINKEDSSRKKVILKRRNPDHKKPEIKKDAKEDKSTVKEEAEQETKESEVQNEAEAPSYQQSKDSQLDSESKPGKKALEKTQKSSFKDKESKKSTKSRWTTQDGEKNFAENLKENVKEPPSPPENYEKTTDHDKPAYPIESSRGRGRGRGDRGRSRGRGREFRGRGTNGHFSDRPQRDWDQEVELNKSNVSDSKVADSNSELKNDMGFTKQLTSSDSDNVKQVKEETHSKETIAAKTAPNAGVEGLDITPSSSEPRRGRSFRGRGFRGRGKSSFKNISKSYNKQGPDGNPN